MLNGIHGHQEIERVVYGKPAGAAVLAEAERLGAKRVFITTTKSVAQSALLAGIIKDQTLETLEERLTSLEAQLKKGKL